jgi:hypothetical protein
MPTNSSIAIRQAVKSIFDNTGILAAASLTPLYLEELPEAGVSYPASLMIGVSDTIRERSTNGEYWAHLLQISIFAVGAEAAGEHLRRVRDVFHHALPDLNPVDGEVLSMQLQSTGIVRDERDLWHAELTYEIIRRADRQYSDG